jgi:HNH endonuclease/AP2 domain
MSRRVTAERLRELLAYAPETGRFYWRTRRGSAAAGREAGQVTAHGYRTIGVDGTSYYAHRLAWLYIHGEHPRGIIDHANGNPTDDRIANLRHCSRTENARNARRRKTTRFKGVYRLRGRIPKWYAQICVNGKGIRLGTFDTAEQAAAAYDAAARRYHGAFARTNADSHEETEQIASA